MTHRFEKAIAYYQRAITKDPRDALAWSGLSDAYMLTAWYHTRPAKLAHMLARKAALRAIALDESLPEAHTSMAVVHENADWGFRAAEHEFQRALEINPNHVTAHHWYGEFLGLMGHSPDALAHLRRAQELDPLSSIIGADTAKVLIDARRYNEAIEVCQSTLELDPGFRPAGVWLRVAHSWSGMHQMAEDETDRLEAGRETSDSYLGRAVTYMASGKPESAEEFRRKSQKNADREQPPAWQMAVMYLQVQPDADKAITWLRKAYDERDPWMKSLKVAPEFDAIRSDPRFQDLVRRMNFPD
jgi:tetratricopeptide (TPR) repeat protein